MIVAEILAYQPDIICLQEVDSCVCDDLLMPVLKLKGYGGFFSSKAGVQSEGCAMFWSLQVFEDAGTDDMYSFPLCDLEMKDSGRRLQHGPEDPVWRQCTASIRQLLENYPALRDMMEFKLGQVVQIAALHLRNRSCDSEPQTIVVGNTHLFYHPMADHIRAIQAFQACRYLDLVRHSTVRGGGTAPIVLCGDLNSSPLSGAVQLLLQGQLDPDHSGTWKYLNEYTWDMGGEEYLLEHGYIGPSLVSDDPIYVNESFEDASEGESEASKTPAGLHLCFPPSFPRLISGYPRIPAFTNYSVGFAETFDYIFVSEPSATAEFGFHPIESAPVPTGEDMDKYGPMPNECMPSDHVSLVCDLAWIQHK